MALPIELNPEQRLAVEHGQGPLLVIAGPGSGKTRVITERIVHLLGGRPAGAAAPAPIARAEHILALTFTERAADEMKRRVRETLPGLERPPLIATFHAFCYHTLRERHFDRVLLDQTDLWIFLRRRLEHLGLELFTKLAEPGVFLRNLNEFFSRCQDELVEPDDFDSYVRRLEQEGRERAAQGVEGSLAADELRRAQELARVFRTSREMIEEVGCSSFGSLMSETLRLWDREPEMLERARRRFRYILVDEFQDTNFAQVELLRRLAAPPYNVTAVGDDDQAIYRFRGASHGAFDMFDRIFPGHATVDLNENYRSTKRIVRVAQVVIARNQRYQAKKPLRTGNSEGSRVFVITAPDEESEAAWIADEVERLAQRGIRLRDVAVLYRSHNYREALVVEFQRRGIPFTIRGLSILSTSILRDLVAYLSLIHSPHDNISLTRVLLAPRWRFSEGLALDLRRQAAKDRCSIYTALQRLRMTLFARELERTAWSVLEDVLAELRQFAASAPITVLFDRLIERLGLTFLPGDRDAGYVGAFRRFLEAWEEKREKGWLDPKGDEPSPKSALRDFVGYLQHFRDAGGIIEEPGCEESTQGVQMMTVHAAKGLEFPVVFVMSVKRRRFPHQEERPVIEFPEALRKSPAAPANIHLEEERRLFYVAMTRARERLYISGAAGTGKPSAFVEDVFSNPVVATRDVERVSAPERPAPPQGPRRPASAGQAAQTPGRGETGQLDLYGSVPAAESPVHPDLSAWAARSVDGSTAKPAEPLRLSASAIETYRSCPLRYKFSYLYKIPTSPQATLTFGGLMHKMVRYYFDLQREALPSLDDIRSFYLRSWRDAGFEDSYQERSYQKAGLEQLREFVERHNRLPAAEGSLFEQVFELAFDGGILVEGRIDQINPLGETAPLRAGAVVALQRTRREQPAGETLREVELIDYKTGKPRSQKEADKSLQLSIYALAARRQLRLDPVRLSFYNLTNNEPVSTVRTEHDLEAAVREVREVAADIRSQRFEPTPGFVCKRCDFVALCPVHEGA